MNQDEPPALHTSQLPRECPAFLACHRRTRGEARLWAILMSDISDGAKVFLCLLMNLMEQKRTREVSIKALCRASKVSRSTAHRYRLELEAAKMLSWEVVGNGGTDLICRYKVH